MYKVFAFFKLIRWLNLLIAGASVLLFHFYVLVPSLGMVKPTLNWWQIGLLALSVMFIMAAGNVMNDHLDFEQDKKFKPHKQVLEKHISVNIAPYIIAVLNFIGISIAAYLAYIEDNYKLINIFLLSMLLLWQYSYTLKKYVLIGNLVVALLCALVFLLPVLFEKLLTTDLVETQSKYYILTQMKGYALFAFTLTLLREIVKDMEDVEADKMFKYSTLPVRFGMKISAATVGFITLLLVAGIAFIMYLYWNTGLENHFWYALLCLQLPLLTSFIFLFKNQDSKGFKMQSVLLKLVMVFGLLSIPLFYWFNL